MFSKFINVCPTLFKNILILNKHLVKLKTKKVSATNKIYMYVLAIVL